MTKLVWNEITPPPKKPKPFIRYLCRLSNGDYFTGFVKPTGAWLLCTPEGRALLTDDVVAWMEIPD